MQIERWDTCEFSFDAERLYANPFRDVELTATFAHEPGGRTITVNGFFDGGGTWRIRFMPLELGTWRYTTRSNDPDLDGRTGSLTCVAPSQPYLHGPLLCDGHHFRHADGTRRFLVSTRMSCPYTSPTVWARMIRFLQQHAINRVLFIMGGIQQTVRELYGKNKDFSRFNVVRFQAIDAVIDALRRADIIASPYFYYFNDGDQRGMTLQDDLAYIKYGMARFGAYANVMPVLGNEIEMKYTERTHGSYNDFGHHWANEVGRYLREQAVFGVPVTVHNPMETEHARHPSFYSLLADWPFPWADLMLRQAQIGSLSNVAELSAGVPELKSPNYNARGYANHNRLFIDLRRFGIPMINEEPGYEIFGVLGGERSHIPRSWNSQTSERMVPTLWTATTAGAYVMWGHAATYETDDPYPWMIKSKTPQYIRVLQEVMATLPYWEMAPANDLVSANEEAVEGCPFRTNFCLAKPGEYYLVFSLNGGALALDLAEGAGYEATQIDPRTGERRSLGSVGAGRQSIDIAGREQVLLLASA